MNSVNTNLLQALQDVISTAEAGVNGRNVTAETRCAECAIIAHAAIIRADNPGGTGWSAAARTAAIAARKEQR